MNETKVAATARLQAAVKACTQAEVEQAVAIAEFAEAHEWTADARFDVIGTRPVRIGADGTALLDEFAALEVATLKGISVASATWLIRDIVNLKARHPLLWFQATRGLIPVFRACMLAAEVARFDLSLEQAQALDERLAPKVPTLPWRRVLQLARGLITELAAEKVAALQQEAREARFVRKVATDDPAVAYLSARVDTADAIFFDAMVDRIADLLGANGDTDLKELRRAKSIGILATPARAQLMLAEAACPSSRSGSAQRGAIRSTDPRLLPQATVFVHLAEETLLRGAGPARVEGVGALPATMLKYLLGHSRVRPGGKRQTRASNLGPLSRKPHRAKTHGDWLLEQPAPGIFWWRTPTGERYRVGPNGTSRIGRNPVHRAFEQALWNSDRELGPPVQGVG